MEKKYVMRTSRSALEFNFWPGVADMILASFLIFLILWFVEKIHITQFFSIVEKEHIVENKKFSDENIKLSEENKKLSDDVAKLSEENKKLSEENKKLSDDVAKLSEENKKPSEEGAKLSEENKKLSEENKKLSEENKKLSEENKRLSDKPPIIELTEAKNYTFESGSYELSNNFKKKLTSETIPGLEKILKKYDVDTIEIIGHTDGQIVEEKNKSNLDKYLEKVNSGDSSIKLKFGSNADLGLIRALAVKNFLLSKTQKKLSINYRIYSAAQLIPPSKDVLKDTIKEPNKNCRQCRRIEIRFTKLNN